MQKVFFVNSLLTSETKMIVFYNPFSKGVMVGEKKKNETMMYTSHQEKKEMYVIARTAT